MRQLEVHSDTNAQPRLSVSDLDQLVIRGNAAYFVRLIELLQRIFVDILAENPIRSYWIDLYERHLFVCRMGRPDAGPPDCNTRTHEHRLHTRPLHAAVSVHLIHTGFFGPSRVVFCFQHADSFDLISATQTKKESQCNDC